MGLVATIMDKQTAPDYTLERQEIALPVSFVYFLLTRKQVLWRVTFDCPGGASPQGWM